MSIIFTMIALLFLADIVRDSLFFAWLWQIKEYRTDRMVSYLKENATTNKSHFGYAIIFLLFLLFFSGLKNYPMIFAYSVLFLFAFLFLHLLNEAKRKSTKRPKPTARILFAFFVLTIFYSFMILCWFLPHKIATANFESKSIALLLFIFIANPVIISSIVLITNPIFVFQKKKIIQKASKKMKSLKKVRTIGITGSYGKTSTKEFLYSILSQKYKVVKTEGNNNTNIGVAYTVLNKVSDEYDFFICEMGAYKMGEIAEICGIAKPEIGILTGINEQHADLFGSIENTIKAKFELIKSLPENGLAVINEKLKMKNEKLQFKVKNFQYFSLADAKNIKVMPDYAEFEYNISGDLIKFKVNFLGKHYIENLISAIIVAKYLGMDDQEIKKAVEKIAPTEYMTKRFGGPEGSIFIDNTYSANPNGVKAALDYLNEAYEEYKKIIVFPGIIELGKERDKIHKILYDKINEVCDKAYILDDRIWKMESGKGKCKFIFEKYFDKTANLLKKDLNGKTVVLFESRGAGTVMIKLKNAKQNIAE